jgi:ribosomal protein L37AE/L43A
MSAPEVLTTDENRQAYCGSCDVEVAAVARVNGVWTCDCCLREALDAIEAAVEKRT